MAKLYVYSTLSSDVAYTNHAPGGADLPQALPSVLIKGGAGVITGRLDTPRGVVTEITEAQAEYLRANVVFKLHEKNGFVEISGTKTDPNKVAAEMEGRDQSAPIVPQDLPPADQPAGTAEPEPEPAPRRTGRQR